MKLLKRTGIFFAILVLVYLVLMFVIPPSSFQVQVTVNRPPAVAWKVFNDETRMGEWLIGFQSMDLIAGEKGAVGSRYRMVFIDEGETIEMEEEMLTVVPEKEFSFVLRNDFIEAEVMIRLEAADAGTLITSDNKVTGVGLIAPLMPLLVGSMQERQIEQYQLLKGIIEAEPQGAAEGK